MSDPGGRVLCVDDHDDTLEVMIHVLRSCGLAVTVARNLNEAQALIEQNGFDAFVLDIRLPDGDGVELCRTIRRKHPDAPIIVMSAAVYERDRARALACGASSFVPKPTDLQELGQSLCLMIAKPGSKENRL
jgi:DNA-binding response OmpR family regulator